MLADAVSIFNGQHSPEGQTLFEWLTVNRRGIKHSTCSEAAYTARQVHSPRVSAIMQYIRNTCDAAMLD